MRHEDDDGDNTKKLSIVMKLKTSNLWKNQTSRVLRSRKINTSRFRALSPRSLRLSYLDIDSDVRI